MINYFKYLYYKCIPVSLNYLLLGKSLGISLIDIIGYALAISRYKLYKYMLTSNNKLGIIYLASHKYWLEYYIANNYTRLTDYQVRLVLVGLYTLFNLNPQAVAISIRDMKMIYSDNIDSYKLIDQVDKYIVNNFDLISSKLEFINTKFK